MKNGRWLKRSVLSVIFASVLIVLTIAHTQVAYADEIKPIDPNPFEKPVLMRVTNYCVNSGKCADGTAPIANYTCGARRDLIGCVAMVYEKGQLKEDGTYAMGEFIGYYEIHDTGSHSRIKSGLSIDIYQNSLDDCWDFTHKFGDELFVMYVEGKG